MAAATELSHDELTRQIAEFLDDYSIEVTPHDLKKFDEIVAELRPGTRVYVAHPPGSPIEDVIDVAAKFQKAGMRAVPHIIARKLSSRDQLARALETARKAGVDEALCIAGDIVVENHAFDASIEVLRTGLFGELGFVEVGVAGHPEGSKAIGEERVAQALRDKVEFAKTAPFRMRFVTQFSFDPAVFTDWEAQTTAQGIGLPIHVGLAGPASLRQLAKFAVMCGVGASARMLVNRTGAMADLLKQQGPDPMILHIAKHRAANPDSRLKTAHIFAFGGVAKSARWVNAARAGRIEFKSNGKGFDVITDR